MKSIDEVCKPRTNEEMFTDLSPYIKSPEPIIYLSVEYAGIRKEGLNHNQAIGELYKKYMPTNVEGK